MRSRIGFQVDHGANPHLWSFPRSSGLPLGYFDSGWSRLLPAMERAFAVGFVVALTAFIVVQGVPQ